MSRHQPPPEEPGSVAYLVSQYPTLSHTFIESQIEALRTAGWRVATFSVRQSPLPDHPETARTPVLQDGGAPALLGCLVRSGLRWPRGVAAGTRAALRHGSGRPLRARVWQVFYLLEALVLHEHLRRRGVRHVHVHFANNGADIARLSAAVGNGVDGPGTWAWSLSVHGPTEFERAHEVDLTTKASQASFVACISDFCRSQVMRFTDPDVWSRLHVVRMGVAPSEGGDAVEANAPTDDEHTGLRVLFVGRLVAEKGPHVLLEAVGRLADSARGASAPTSAPRPAAPAVEVVIAGTGPLEASLRAAAARLGSGVDVRFLGGVPHDDLERWYRWADVFCLPSFAEGLPVVLMEALSHRVPVVTTAVAGIPELVRDGVSGLLVAPGRADLVAEALRRLADDPSLRTRLGDTGHSVVKTQHDAQRNGILLGELLAHSA